MSFFEGSLAEMPLSEVLQRLQAEGRTGVLTLQSRDDIVAISIEGGRIVGVDALHETLEEGLGSVLVEEGLLTDREFDQAAGRVGVQGRIGEVLVAEGLMTREDFLTALRSYTLGLLRSVQSWTKGEFRFYVGEDVSYEEGFEPVRIQEVLSVGEAPEAVEPEAVEQDEPPEVTGATPVETELEAIELFEPSIGESPIEPEAFELEPEPEPMDVLDEPVQPSPLQAALRRVNDWLTQAPDWVARVAPLLVLLVLVTAIFSRPNALVYPFFWLETERLELEKQRRTSVYLKIDRAAKTFFLLEGRFPDDLHALVTRGLLAPDDIAGAGGRVLAYTPGDRGYVIRPGAPDGTDPGASKTEAIAGDFFLDPEFAIQPPDRGPAPLVLLD